MGLADDLLGLADRLAHPEPAGFEQASLRRAVSTAYYALFHLLAGEVAALWQGGSDSSRGRLERAVQHGTMEQVSTDFSKQSWIDWSDRSVSVPEELQKVAKAFVQLQQARHEADYNSGRAWTFTEVHLMVRQARDAFQHWQIVRTQSIAQDYLLSLLVGRKRR